MSRVDLDHAAPGADRRVVGVRTFHPRRGRLSGRHLDALARLWPVYGVEITDEPIDPAALFRRRAPLVLEIGSGMGEATAAMATVDPARDYLAAEVHTPGVANLLALIEEHELTNLRVVHGDALEMLRRQLAPERLVAVHAYFPDPWPKARHHKRRLFQPEHVALLRSRLVRGGTLHAATDWADYAQMMRHTLMADPHLVNAHDGWAPRPAHRPMTKFERRAIDDGRAVFEVVFHRT